PEAVRENDSKTQQYVESLAHRRQRKTLAQGLQLAQLCQEHSIEHLHAHFMTVSSHVAAICRLIGGPTFSVTAHAKDIFREGIDLALFRQTAKIASSLVTVSHFNERYILNRFFDKERAKVKVIYNGLPLEKLELLGAQASRQPGEILAVGRLVEKKGFDVLLQACAELKSAGQSFHLKLVGKGDQASVLEELVKNLDLSDYVSFLGALPREEVVRLMHAAELLVLPCRRGSDGNSDALPTVLIEALGCGLPVISTDFVGIPEIVVHEECGILVSPDDVNGLTDAIARMLGDAPMRMAFAKVGRARAHALFDRSRTLPQLMDVFVDCIRRSESGSESS
ncbi:MAG: colanic acid/amylovoran biosynthesis glycosyltransferase, partial [Planctomycetota bacterium]